MADPSTRIFRVSLRPRLYREIEVDSGRSLHDLAEAIVRAFDFDLDQAFGFHLLAAGLIRLRFVERWSCQPPVRP